MRKLLLLVLVAVGLFAGALPADAATTSWTDAKGDATQFLAPGVEGVVPNEPALDIVKVKITSDAKKIVWAITTDKMSEAGPSLNAGYFFRMTFGFGGDTFVLRAKKDQIEEKLYFRNGSDQVGTDLPCKDCTEKFDFKASTLVITTPIASLAQGIKAADDPVACPLCRTGSDPLPAFKSGVELDQLDALAQRIYVRTTPTADDAPAPDGTLFKV